MHVDDIVAVSNSCMFLRCIGVMFRHTIAHFFALFPGSGSVSFSKFTCQKSVFRKDIKVFDDVAGTILTSNAWRLCMSLVSYGLGGKIGRLH